MSRLQVTTLHPSDLYNIHVKREKLIIIVHKLGLWGKKSIRIRDSQIKQSCHVLSFTVQSSPAHIQFSMGLTNSRVCQPFHKICQPIQICTVIIQVILWCSKQKQQQNELLYTHTSLWCSRKRLTGLQKLIKQTGEDHGISLPGNELEERGRDQLLLLQGACPLSRVWKMWHHTWLRNGWRDEFEFQTLLLQSRCDELQ